ncbi:hypothetical protein V5799_004327 [Amblyomma americanum]|uniref:VWFA domain-containing protein n=1 Tax=Amblyomma americanum TaxID=6943 RepID=A0AAQ4D6F1_AMBAM
MYDHGRDHHFFLLSRVRACIPCPVGTAVVLLLLAGWDGLASAAIRLQDDGGYVDVVVSVHEALPVDPGFLEKLKSALSNSSAFLHRATRGYVHLRDITIALPPHWPPAEHGDAPASLRAHAPIRIVSDEGSRWPRTVQPRPCGQPGEYILMPVNAIRHPRADYLMAHEWAHLRYGVFDEFGAPGDSLYPAVYKRGGQTLSNTCSASIVTSPQKQDGSPCGIIEGALEEDCIDFEPVAELTDARSSVMFLPPLPTVDSFCDDSSELAHNADAPSPQNAICDGRSTWSVISATEDIRRPGRLVVAMDVSGSMAQGDRLVQLRRAVGRFLEDTAPDNTVEVSLVAFNQRARVVAPLTKLNTTVRKRLRETALPVTVGGWTSLGAGLNAALKILESAGSEGSAVLLITDGEENRPPFLASVLPALVSARVTLYALAVTAEAQATLDKVAQDTGGRAFTAAGSDDVVTSILEALSSAAAEQLDEEARPITVVSEWVNSTRIEVPLDEELGRNTQFVSSTRSLEAVSPSGERFVGTYDTGLRRSKLVFDKAWVEHYDALCLSDGTLDSAAVGAGTVLERAAPHLPPAVVHAELLRGATPVPDAHVTASVRTPRGREVSLLLRDDGAGTDIAAGDGVYSAAFGDFETAGRYEVRVRTRNRREADGKHASFSRYADAGGLWVGAVDGGLVYAPSTVRDLRVLGARRTARGRLVTLAWTAPGDQLDEGTCAGVELFAAATASPLRTLPEEASGNESSVHRVLKSELVAGSRLSPPPAAGELHQMSLETTWVAADGASELFFAVVALSHGGLRSAPSNVAVAVFPANVEARASGALVPPWLPVLLCSLAAVAGVLVLAAAYLRVRRREVLRSDRPVSVFAASPGKAQLEMACRASLLTSP